MPRLSFPWFAGPFVPGPDRCKRAALAGAVVVLGGCGGGDAGNRIVSGTGYTFQAPRRWEIVRAADRVQAAEGGHSVALVGVSRFPLLHVFHASLWHKVVRELDGAAEGIARQQHGSVTVAREVTVSNERARRYELVYDLRGRKLVEELAFVLRGKTEYLLLCRYEQGRPHDACDTLIATFKLT
jgi:hypothetical protein